MNRAHRHLYERIKDALLRMGVQKPRVILEKPRDPSHGDIACNAAMVHAKDLRKPPRAIADEILNSLELDREYITGENTAGPGFLNFFFADSYLRSIVKQALDKQDDFGNSGELSDRKILLEFVSANPTGPLNIVSARAAAVGDTLAHLFKARGAHCECEYYVNDTGEQVRLLGESVQAWDQRELGIDADIPEAGYHGEYLRDTASATRDELEDDIQLSSDEIISDEIIIDRGRQAVEHHIQEHGDTLERFRVHMDRWFHESELKDKGDDQRALNRLKSSGATDIRDGAVYLKTSEFGDTQDWVVVTSDGRPTYFLPDIAYHLNKYERGYHHVINILGPDHHSYAGKMRAALRALGENPDLLEVILLQHVTLMRGGEPVKMSKRAGQIVAMTELLDEVGVDAGRYFFLLRRTSTPLDFDIDLAKTQTDDNPVFYVQYAHARIESIFRKAGVGYPAADEDLTPLREPEELDLMRRLRELQEVIVETTDHRDPHGITVWLREVATQFHKFYHDHRVLTEPLDLQKARLALCRATQIALAKGLTLCGVSSPKEM